MERMEETVRALGRMMKNIGATREDGIAVLLLLETEEDMQQFFTWFRNLKKDPTPQECFEKAVEISGIMEDLEDED